MHPGLIAVMHPGSITIPGPNPVDNKTVVEWWSSGGRVVLGGGRVVNGGRVDNNG